MFCLWSLIQICLPIKVLANKNFTTILSSKAKTYRTLISYSTFANANVGVYRLKCYADYALYEKNSRQLYLLVIKIKIKIIKFRFSYGCRIKVYSKTCFQWKSLTKANNKTWLKETWKKHRKKEKFPMNFYHFTADGEVNSVLTFNV